MKATAKFHTVYYFKVQLRDNMLKLNRANLAVEKVGVFLWYMIFLRYLKKMPIRF